jgi:hypothetical protein
MVAKMNGYPPSSGRHAGCRHWQTLFYWPGSELPSQAGPDGLRVHQCDNSEACEWGWVTFYRRFFNRMSARQKRLHW